MDASDSLSEGVIFPKGERAANEYFAGTAWVQALVAGESTFQCPVYNVSFEPGARNNWHRHPGGQILLVTGSRGYYQEEGKKAQVIREGDVVKIPPGVKHWHGAAPDSRLAHLRSRRMYKEGKSNGWSP
ncbi:Cupin 2 conserved barrel domain protein [Methanofollis liminatans DSM 4140]|jgi:quercetin dioxygenase-like cupin family protein|uniref:Cupin 2 conserved barrel domain protein n=1 Tax=Methanofollis liminatans DSM 4140 TaxID=28892 RepID=J1L1U6_9EURY|nr:cupin domain-containing protein [Methanofollis liminatans]EJG07002.1 Cupin 2 conserved barrel domain protein [Methanofollis liminatans DSM 4140]